MIIWSDAVEITDEGYYPLVGAFLRVEVTTAPGYLTHSAAALARYRGLGSVGPAIGELVAETQTIQYLDAIYGPFPEETDQAYIFLQPGVVANYYRGYLMSELNQPSGTMAITSTHALADGVATTLTWQSVEDGLGQIPNLSDLRVMKPSVKGLYLALVTLGLPAATYTDLLVRVLLNGTAFRTLDCEPVGVIGANGLIKAVSCIIPVSANDDLRINVRQTSGASRNLDTNTRWNLVRLGDI